MMTRTPQQHYHDDLASKRIIDDPLQQRAIIALEEIFTKLQRHRQLKKLLTIVGHRKRIKGLYLHGPVGSGKTYLLDTFYHCVEDEKLRMNFYEFMQMIQARLKILIGKKNPLKLVAKQLAQKYTVICFDEFFVSNIVDAMLLGNLLTALFREGVCLIATSNIIPDNLYKNGLQRELFLPAIAILKQNVQVLEVDNHIDYRQRDLTLIGSYFTPLDDYSHRCMQQQFYKLSQGEESPEKTIKILNRSISVIKKSKRIVWFDFSVLCQIPRSQLDYLALAKQFDTLLLSGVRALAEREHNIVCLFISLVDVLYDAKVRLIISAECSIEQIYTGSEQCFEFRRTKSRIVEMQSLEYQQLCAVQTTQLS